jgi:hypothetical protein
MFIGLRGDDTQPGCSQFWALGASIFFPYCSMFGVRLDSHLLRSGLISNPAHEDELNFEIERELSTEKIEA